ncbi:MAG TPA: response regulator [Pirellulales bacterium]|jgi:two-component system KDP operon response regulator KdpE
MAVDGPKILIIEDEQEIRRFLRASLAAHGFRFVEAETGQQGLMLAASQQPDLIVLDLGLPDMDGIDLIPRIREWSSLPIIVLSARGQEREKVAALDAGADDYLTKPFGMGELLARMRVALRHSLRHGAEGESPVFTVDQLTIDLSSRQITTHGKDVHLTPTEFRLLATLIRYAGKVVTHRQLLNEVWGPDSLDETHSLRVYMAKLRDKIEQNSARPRYLLTEPGVGYRLVAE